MIEAEWVERWAAKYPRKYDETLGAVHENVCARGYYDRADLMTVAEWKLTGSYWPKHREELEKGNTDDDIRDITRTALMAPLGVQHRVMGLIKGVGDPVASALLMVWDDEQHTVIDRKAVKSLVRHGEIERMPGGVLPPYPVYLLKCQRIRERCGCDLRTLDHALYMANGSLDLPPRPRS